MLNSQLLNAAQGIYRESQGFLNLFNAALDADVELNLSIKNQEESDNKDFPPFYYLFNAACQNKVGALDALKKCVKKWAKQHTNDRAVKKITINWHDGYLGEHRVRKGSIFSDSDSDYSSDSDVSSSSEYTTYFLLLIKNTVSQPLLWGDIFNHVIDVCFYSIPEFIDQYKAATAFKDNKIANVANLLMHINRAMLDKNQNIPGFDLRLRNNHQIEEKAEICFNDRYPRIGLVMVRFYLAINDFEQAKLWYKTIPCPHEDLLEAKHCIDNHLIKQLCKKLAGITPLKYYNVSTNSDDDHYDDKYKDPEYLIKKKNNKKRRAELLDLFNYAKTSMQNMRSVPKECTNILHQAGVLYIFGKNAQVRLENPSVYQEDHWVVDIVNQPLNTIKDQFEVARLDRQIDKYLKLYKSN